MKNILKNITKKSLILLIVMIGLTTNGFAIRKTYISNSYLLYAIAIDNQGNKWFGTDGGGVSKFDGTTWTTYTTNQGLANNKIHFIAIDSQGNKWFGTSGGVSKFDGTTWTTYTTANGLANNSVRSIAIDSQGNKWFGTNGGVSKFDGTNWTTYTVTNGLANNSVWSIAIDSQGNKWFGTNAGVSKFDGIAWTVYTTANGLANNSVRSIAIDSQGNKWFGTDGGGISKFDGTTWTTYTTMNGLASNNVYSIVIDSQDNKWIGTNSGVSKFDSVIWTSYTTNQGLANNSVRSIAIDSQGNKWFGTYSAVSKFDGTTWTTYAVSQGLVNNHVLSIAIDNQGNKWFGTDNGVSKFDGTTWTTYTTADGLANNHIYSIAIDSQGNKWFGSYGKVNKFDDTTWTTYTTNELSSYNAIVCSIKIDSQGNKWFGTDGRGIFKFDGSTWIMYTTGDGLSGSNVFSIEIDNQGNKWVGTNNGVSKFDGTTWTTYTTTTTINPNQGLASRYVRSIAIDSQGNKWFGTDGGVSKFDGTNWITYTTANGLASNDVQSIAIDSQGNKWFGTDGGGVSKFDGTNWTTYTTNQGLLSNYVYSITIDSQGNKWFGTDGSGVTMVSSDEVWNTAPVFSFINSTNYISDGLYPEAGGTTTYFVYRISYLDVDNDEPYSEYPKIHIKKDGIEISGSPFLMTYITGGYDTGAIFEYSKLLSPGTSYTYYFEARDKYNTPGIGNPTTEIDAPDVFNFAPVLLPTGEEGYVSDGVNPETGNDSTGFVFRVKYSDMDNDAPKSGYPKLHIKKGGTDILYSPFNMTAVNTAQYTEGRVYSYSTTLSSGTDYIYYFEAYDVYDATATGTPVTPVDAPDVIIPTSTADHYEITVPTSNIIAGNSFTITITAKDSSNNTVTNYSGSVNVQAVLASDVSRAGSGIISVSNATLVNGTVTISNQSYTKGENIKIKVTDSNNISSVSDTVTILPSSDISMSVTANPLSVVNGQGTQIIVAITDYYNNPVPNQTVNFTISKGSGTLSNSSISSDSFGKVNITFTPNLSGSGNCIILAGLGLLQREVTISVSMLIVAGNSAVVSNADDPQTKIVIPSGVLTSNALININKQTAFPGEGQQFEITAKNQDTNDSIVNLDRPVDVTFHYQVDVYNNVANTNVSASDAVNKLALYYNDGVTWQKIGGTVNTANQTVTAKTTHLSKYALKETAKASAFRFSGIGPNPFTPNPDGISDRVYFYFDNPDGKDVEVKIYDLEGRLVRDVPVTAGVVPYWDGRNKNNDVIEGGVYIYKLKVGDNVVTGTIVLGK